MDNPEMGTYPVRKRLPTTHYTEIGRIITRFAFIERQLHHITRLVLDVGRKQGRLAIHQFRARDQLILIKDLGRLNGLKFKVDWKTLGSALKELESYRDRISHCVWIKHPDTKTPVLQDFSTAYVQGLPQGTKPKITPLAVELPLEMLRAIRINGDKISDQILKLENVVLKQLGS